MNLNTSIQVGARFKLIAHKGDPNTPTKETGWIKNLVLDSGLDRLSVGPATTLVAVGTGNSTPVVSQTTLDNVLAITDQIQGAEVGLSNTTTSPYYYGARKTYRFDEGLAAGNLAEIGIGWSATDMFNRTLIKDALGNPTTLTILSDEFLDIVVELRHYPQNSFTGTFNLLNKLGDVVSTHNVNGVCYISGIALFTFEKMTLTSLGLYNGIANLESVTSDPSGASVTLSARSETYPTTRSLTSVWTLGLDQANFNITSVKTTVRGLCNRIGDLGYKFEISPPITKNSSQIMSLTLNVSWTRYV